METYGTLPNGASTGEPFVKCSGAISVRKAPARECPILNLLSFDFQLHGRLATNMDASETLMDHVDGIINEYAFHGISIA